MTASIARSPATGSSSDCAARLSLERSRAAFRSLETWMFSEAALALPIAELERRQEELSREANRLLLQAHLERRGTGDLGPGLEVVRDEEGGERREVLYSRRLHSRQIRSIFGKVSAIRTGYGGKKRQGFHPLDADLQLPRKSFTQEVQRRVSVAAVQGPFDEVIERVRESSVLKLSKRSVEQIVADAAVDFDSFYEERNPPVSAQAGSLVVCAADCKGVPMVKPERTLRVARRGKGERAQKKRMATVGAVFTQAPFTRTPEEVVESLFFEGPTPLPEARRHDRGRAAPEHKRVWASIEKSKDDVLDEIVAEMERRDPRHAKEWVAVIDGERALQHGIVERLPGVHLVLDIMHALQRLWDVSYCFHPEGSPEAREWVKKRAHQILRGRVSQVVKGIRQSSTKRGFTRVKKETVRIATQYLMRNRKRMRYDEYLRKGFPIASGAVEGACKNLVKDRMERSGMRWSLAGGEALLRLRAAYLSDDLPEYLRYHFDSEQTRLYPPGSWGAVEK